MEVITDVLDETWLDLRAHAEQAARSEPVLVLHLQQSILERDDLADSLAVLLATKLASADLTRPLLAEVFRETFVEGDGLIDAALYDLHAALERDPASHGVANVYLNHKGFHALQAYRLAHRLWVRQRRSLSLHLQARVSEVLAVDIHPAARIGRGVFVDHATGVVIGETAVVADNVSLLQEVTLGGTGKDSGDRHPKVEKGVLVCAGAKVLGNIRIGEGSKIGAGSVVLRDVPPHTTVAGVPARPVGRPAERSPAWLMDQRLRG
jgi:serine O-acetyltransferase